MKHTVIAAAFCLLFASFSFGQADGINIIPKPKRIRSGEGIFALNTKTILVARTTAERKIAILLNSYLRKTFGMDLKVAKPSKPGPNTISVMVMTGDHSLLADEYRIAAKTKDVELAAVNEETLFYGLQTLLQLFRKDEKGGVAIPVVDISDSPRFKYRGMHLDVARHFMPVDFVKKYIDLMSQYKFNTFHWHLTDDQGWRIEIKKYPRLTEVGSKRPETVSGRVLQPYVGDGVPVEGFYTQEQIRDVVAYAKARYITVIPEIELPGHASAALEAYPQFGCKKDYTYKVQKTWGIFKEVFCPTDETFTFLEDVIDETISLFPDSPYVHIGGDEVLKDHWKESAFVQDLMKRENLKDEHEVQSYFVRRIEKHVNAKGKKIIGWDEILEGGLAPNATVMSWRGIKGGIEAAKAKHDVIMTPTDFCYLDYGQGDPATEPINIGGYLTLEKVYSYDPVPKELTPDEAKYILGVQGNIWTEYIKTPDKVEYMAFPRMLALAEVGWSSPENKDFAGFTRRLNANFARLDKQEVDYRIPEPAGMVNKVLGSGETADIDLSTPIPAARVYYTTDGSTPTETSTPYGKPLQPSIPAGGRLDVKAIVVLATGRTSSVYTATLLRKEMLEAVQTEGTKSGVDVRIRTGFEGGTIVEDSRSVLLNQFENRTDVPRPFDVSFGGYFVAPVDGIYEFQIESVGSASFGIHDERVTVDGKGTRTLNSMIVPLKKGQHPIQINYNKYVGQNDSYRVRWAIKGQNWRNLGGGELVH